MPIPSSAPTIMRAGQLDSSGTFHGRLRLMSRYGRLAVAILLVTAAAEATADDAPAAAASTEARDDARLQGEYVTKELGVQIVARGAGQFLVVIHKGGLPGAGWDRSPPQTLEEDAAGIHDLIDTLQLEHVERRSPTLGLRPPPGAIVLFDGTAECLTEHWRTGARISEDGLLIAGATTRDTFQDHTLHVEFQTPFLPEARDQARGNSGVYCQARFEAQVLDSFGLSGKMNEAGGIYSIRDPDLNMCLPPLAWQTYDIDFVAARYDESGAKIADARMTVRLNGVTVQPDVQLPHTTTAAPLGESPAAGPLYLQDHGSPVHYRNIWVLPRDHERESRRPIVPGFERFHAAAGEDAAAGGRLLLGELACTRCHAASVEWSASLLVKEPPVLDEVGSRLQPEWMLKFLRRPHDVKPGTTMPGLIETLPEAEREPAARAIVNFLMTTGSVAHAAPEPAAAQRGARLFHEVGCVQCHAPRDGTAAAAGSSVPLVGLEQKYTVPSLAGFLKEPQKVRPSGRMPGWDLDDKQLQDIAAYLIGEISLKPLTPNLTVSIYEGSWNDVPDFDSLTPVKTMPAAGLDVNVADRSEGFGLVFEGYLPIEKNGTYTFHLGSDDGSRLVIDGVEVVRNGGIHPHQVASGSTKLQAGPHAVRVEYFEQGGDQSLTLEYESKNLTRQDVTHRFTLTPDAAPAQAAGPSRPDEFVFDASLVDLGRELFAALGCASCHQLKQGEERIASTSSAKPLAECRPEHGCLADAETPSPRYELSPRQTLAIRAALAEGPKADAARPEAVIHRTLLAFNCYACHTRGGMGGPTRERNEYFATTIPEMGDEGRLPPPLDGVGDKLNDPFLAEVLRNGSDDRDYIRTQMPKFGEATAALANAFVALDRRTEAPLAEMPEALHRVKAAGRQLVGDKGLACIKCHSFGPHKATGIQAINLHTMPRRLRADWFLRYLKDPNVYRPGTRMPTGFPNGQAAIRDVYHGDPQQQITAIWRYLEDGSKAGIPDGLIARLIELKPVDAPIIYRNFIDGLSPRGIAVGYPEKCHLAWDAGRMCLGLVWHGRFLDASRHWEGRGSGFQSPLGDHVLRIEETVPVAALPSNDSPWPTAPPRNSGYQFQGYRLDSHERPEFQYAGTGFTVTDAFEPQAATDGSPWFRRRLSILAASGVEGLHFRAARGRKIEPLSDGGWRIDGALTIRLAGGGTPFVRESNGSRELLVPCTSDALTEIVQELEW